MAETTNNTTETKNVKVAVKVTGTKSLESLQHNIENVAGGALASTAAFDALSEAIKSLSGSSSAFGATAQALSPLMSKTGKLAANINVTATSLMKAAAAAKGFSTAMKALGSANFDKSINQFNLLMKSMTGRNSELHKLARDFKAISSSLVEMNRAIENYHKTSAKVAVKTNRNAVVGSDNVPVDTTAGATGSKKQRTLTPFGTKLSTMTSYYGAASIIMSTREAIASMAQLQDSFAQIQGIAGLSDETMAKLSKTILDVGTSSKYTTNELAQATVTLAQAGLSAEQITDVLDTVNKLAVATGSDLKTAVGTMTSILSIWEMQSTEAARAADVLTTTLNKSKAEMQSIANGLQYAGAAAAQMGISFEETAAAMGAVTNAGIKARSSIGTGFRALVTELTNPTKRLTNEVERLGLSMSDIDVKQNGLIGVVQTLKRAGFDSEASFKGFERRSATFYAALSSQLDSYDKIREAMNRGGSTAESYEKQMNTLTAQFARLKNSILGATAGLVGESGIGKGFTLFVKQFSDAAQNAATWVNSLSEPVTTYETQVDDLTGSSEAYAETLNALGNSYAKLIAEQNRLMDNTKELINVRDELNSKFGGGFDSYDFNDMRGGLIDKIRQTETSRISEDIKRLASNQGALRNQSARFAKTMYGRNSYGEFNYQTGDGSALLSALGVDPSKMYTESELDKLITTAIQGADQNKRGLVGTLVDRLIKNDGTLANALKPLSAALGYRSSIEEIESKGSVSLEYSNMANARIDALSGFNQNALSALLAQAGAATKRGSFQSSEAINSMGAAFSNQHDIIKSLAYDKMENGGWSKKFGADAIIGVVDQLLSQLASGQRRWVDALEKESKEIGTKIKIIEKEITSVEKQRGGMTSSEYKSKQNKLTAEIEEHQKRQQLIQDKAIELNKAESDEQESLKVLQAEKLKEIRYRTETNAALLRLNEIENALLDNQRKIASKRFEDANKRIAGDEKIRADRLSDMNNTKLLGEWATANGRGATKSQQGYAAGVDTLNAQNVYKQQMSDLSEKIKAQQKVLDDSKEAYAANVKALNAANKTLENTKESDVDYNKILERRNKIEQDSLSLKVQTQTAENNLTTSQLAYDRSEKALNASSPRKNGAMGYLGARRSELESSDFLNDSLYDGLGAAESALKSFSQSLVRGEADLATTITSLMYTITDSLVSNGIDAMIKAASEWALTSATENAAKVSETVTTELATVAIRGLGMAAIEAAAQLAAIGAAGAVSGGMAAAATGGVVVGGVPGKDSVPTMLMPGEFVMKKSAVDIIGQDTLHDLNSGANTTKRLSDQSMTSANVSNKKGGTAVTNVYVVDESEKDKLKPNDVIAIIGKDIKEGGQTRKLIGQTLQKVY